MNPVVVAYAATGLAAGGYYIASTETMRLMGGTVRQERAFQAVRILSAIQAAICWPIYLALLALVQVAQSPRGGGSDDDEKP